MDTEAMPRRFGRESVWVVAMTMLGAGVRLKGLGTLGLDHFDEGIYAQAAAWVLAEGGLRAIDPGLIPYAPPGFPILVGLAYQAIGPTGASAILVSILAGVLTIPALSWLARKCFGRGAGAATASLVALSGPHIVFCRTGLTDVTFLLCWALVMIAGLMFLERPNAWRAMGLGLVVGLAQLVKYNGWMAGVVVMFALLAGSLRPGEVRKAIPRTFGLGLIAVVVSALVYLPWFLFVERTTGYAGLLAHHSSYVDGLAGWWPNWRQQMGQADAMAGPIPIGPTWLGLSIALGWLGAAIGQGSSPRSWGRLRYVGPLVVLAIAVASLATPPNLLWWAALTWSPALLLDSRASSRLVAVWFLMMALSTPLYHPYARLWLPTLAAGWVAGGGLIATVLARFRWLATHQGPDAIAPARRARPALIAALVAIVLAIVGLWLGLSPIQRFPDLLVRSDGVRTLADAIRSDPDASPRSTVHLYARPALRFYLAERGVGPIAIHGDLASIRSSAPRPGDRAIIDAAQGVTPAQAAELGAGGPWRIADTIDVPASIPTLLDVRPECITDPDARYLGREPAPDDDRPRFEDHAGSSRFWILVAP